MKTNRMSRMLALALALIMVLCAFTGCGKKNEDQIVGKWQSSLKFSDVMEEALKQEEDAAELFADADFSGIEMLMVMECKEDGTYALNFDQASGEEAVKKMAEVLIPNLKELMRKEVASSTGSDVTDEELDSMLSMMGMESWDDFGDMIMKEINPSEIFSEAAAEGKYMLKDGKLYTSNALDEEITEQSDIDLYELSGNTLKLTSQQNQEDVPDFMKEITFTRVG